MEEEDNYGILVRPSIKIQRSYFKECCRLLGVKAIYKAPAHDKHYTLHGEFAGTFQEPIEVNCIFEDHLTQKTAKKFGWDVELNTEAAVIHVPYDLQDLQVGALFTIPSAYDNTKGRTFRVVELSAVMIYPASISCKLVPEYETTVQRSELEIFNETDFNLLNQG